MKLKPIKIFCVPKRLWSSLLCLCAVIAMFASVNFIPRAVGAGAAERQLPIYCVERDQKVCSLSFDAAWGDIIVRQTCKIIAIFNLFYNF